MKELKPFIFEKRHICGVARMYPVSDVAKYFAYLMRKKTFTEAELSVIAKIGHEMVEVNQKPDKEDIFS